MSAIFIRGARVVDAHRGGRGAVADVRVEGNTIVAVGDCDPRGAEVIEGAGYALIPGFVNTHTHAGMVLFRGFTDDTPLMEWLEKKIWPVERNLTAEHVYRGTRLAALEMLSSGTTTFHDMYFFGQAAARAAQDMGVRATIAQVCLDVFGKKPVAELRAEVEEGLDRLAGLPTVRPSIGPHAAYTVPLDALAMIAQVAERRDTVVHFHLAETQAEVDNYRRQHGRGLVEALEAVGFLSPRLICAHGIFLDQDDARRLGATGTTISHCPTSNMKLATGWSDAGPRALPYRRLREAGVRVTLGTDGAASNNDLDMFQAMKLAALLQKHNTGDPTALPAREAFAMATVEGARALGLKAGLVAPGYLADLVLLDLSRPYLAPGHDLIADIVYAAKPDCVDTVIVDGRVVLRGGRRPDAQDVIAQSREAAIDLIQRAGLDVAPAG